MSGGWLSQVGKRAGWCGPEPFFLGRLHGPPFFAREAGYLDGLGAAGPAFKRKNSAERLSFDFAQGIVTEGRDPASRVRDLRGLVTSAKAGGVEPDPAQPDAPKRAWLDHECAVNVDPVAWGAFLSISVVRAGPVEGEQPIIPNT